MTEADGKRQSAPEIEGFQRSYLRGLAHDRKPVVQVGQAGITDEVLTAINNALLDHELIKVRLQHPEDKKGMAQALAERTASCLCGLIGHTVVLFRPHPDKPRIRLPQRD